MRVDLPEPSDDERAHSERLVSLIREEIAMRGSEISFERFMELALYAPGLGYYSAGAAKFGASGDFITAPELGSVFARCLARAVSPTLRDTDGIVLELGPGTGALAAELLLEWERGDRLPSQYFLLERSADLRVRQQETLHARCAHLVERVKWLDAPPTESWSGALIANEVIDALPVRLFEFNDDRFLERCVGVDDEDRFAWRTREPDERLLRAIETRIKKNSASWPQRYRSEICLTLSPWFDAITASMLHGSAWFIDYGYERDDYYSPDRREGTLRCHYRHRAHDDALSLVGLQDITASVDFDALAEAAEASGFRVGDFCTQSSFLMANGLDDVFGAAYAACTNEVQRYRLAQEVKRLTLPSQMGETFKVMTLRKDI